MDMFSLPEKSVVNSLLAGVRGELMEGVETTV